MKSSTNEPGGKQSLEVESLVTISTAHLDPKDVQLLEEAGIEHPWFIFAGSSGYLLHTSYSAEDPLFLTEVQQQLIAKGYSYLFIGLWNWAVSCKYDWVRLTEWGDVVSELPVFEWK